MCWLVYYYMEYHSSLSLTFITIGSLFQDKDVSTRSFRRPDLRRIVSEIYIRKKGTCNELIWDVVIYTSFLL